MSEDSKLDKVAKHYDNYDKIAFENPDKLRELDKKNRLLDRKHGYITIHDVLMMVRLIEVTMKRGGIKEEEKEDVLALKQRFTKFLNLAVPEEFDILAEREKVDKFVAEEQAKIEATRLPDGSLPAQID